MIGAEEFGPEFQRVLVRTCLDDPGLRTLVGQFAGAGHLAFTDPASAWAWNLISAVDRPSLLMLQTEARRLTPMDAANAGAQALLQAEDVRDNEYVRQAIVTWARRQTFEMAMGAVIDVWNRGEKDDAMTLLMGRIEELEKIRLENADRGWFFEELEGRQERRAFVDHGLDYFPLGIGPIDAAMHGGLSYGELEIPFAYSGIGKSFYCVHRGFVATRMRRRVLHFVLEGGRAKIEDRYEARFASTVYSSVRSGQIDGDVMHRMRREYAICRRGLVLRGYADRLDWAISIKDLRAELVELRQQSGWVPDLILVDYGDLVHAPGDTDRERQKNAFRGLKTLAEAVEFRGHRGYAVCAPSQAIRPDPGADEREHVLQPRDVADCYEKTRIADAVVSINRTIAEQKNKRARLNLGKYRDNEDHVVVRIQTDYAHGGLAVLGVPEPPPLAPPPSPTKGKPKAGRP